MHYIFKRHKVAIVLFLAPVVLLFGAIVVVPVFQATAMSFTKWNGVGESVFIGFANYKKMFLSPDLKVSIKNSILFSVVLTIYQIGLGTLFAFILANIKIKAKRFFRDIFFFPVLLSISVVAQLWVNMYHGDYGLINQLARAIGLDCQQNWLNEPVKGIIAIVIAEAWKGMGYHMLIIYAAMRNVPTVYYEASFIDGASAWKQFKNITLPMIMPTLRMSFIMCITYGFRAFESITLMTAQGGPGNINYTLSYMMYKALFRLQEYGYSSAIATLIVVICISVMLVINGISARNDIRG